MTDHIDLHSIMADLSSNQIEKQIAALDNASEIINTLAKKAVDAFTRSPDRLLDLIGNTRCRIFTGHQNAVKIDRSLFPIKSIYCRTPVPSRVRGHRSP